MGRSRSFKAWLRSLDRHRARPPGGRWERLALISWGLRQPDVDRIIAKCDPANAASVRVLEKAATARNLGMMRKVIVTEWMTLDGVVQAPGAPDEDTSGGFKHGAWHLGYFDDISRKWVVDNLNEAGGFLLGRRTYEGFAVLR